MVSPSLQAVLLSWPLSPWRKKTCNCNRSLWHKYEQQRLITSLQQRERPPRASRTVSSFLSSFSIRAMAVCTSVCSTSRLPRVTQELFRPPRWDHRPTRVSICPLREPGAVVVWCMRGSVYRVKSHDQVSCLVMYGVFFAPRRPDAPPGAHHLQCCLELRKTDKTSLRFI